MLSWLKSLIATGLEEEIEALRVENLELRDENEELDDSLASASRMLAKAWIRIAELEAQNTRCQARNDDLVERARAVGAL
jgi:cell division septum initiation protein DivIVA